MNMECSLLYVSRVRIDAQHLDDELVSIITWSDDYNPSVGITGGLVRAQSWFAQLIEGSAEAVDTLMQSIKRDPRHDCVTILAITPRRTRRLTRWSLAYAGDWHYMSETIGKLIDPAVEANEHDIQRLEEMIVEFATG